MLIDKARYRTTSGGASKKVEEPIIFATEVWHDILLGGAGSGISATVIITEYDCLHYLELMRRAREADARKAQQPERVA